MNQISVKQLKKSVELSDKRSAESESVEVLTDIYQDDINISIWKRNLSSQLIQAAERVMSSKHQFSFSASLTPEGTFDSLYKALGANDDARLISDDIAEIVDMFCCLFDLKQVGLRLTELDRAMCPRFHVDRVPCRLVTTYSEVATEWLEHNNVDRSKLGTGNNGKSDAESGIYRDSKRINQLKCGEIALLKGESWLGNEGAGLVHRSPALSDNKKRLLLTLDFN